MTITDTDKIDIVATRPDTRVVKLVICDHLPWGDVLEHCRLIQEKLNICTAFVESGQLSRMKGQFVPQSPEFLIVLAAMHEPPEDAADFFTRARAILANIGMRFEIEVAA